MTHKTEVSVIFGLKLCLKDSRPVYFSASVLWLLQVAGRAACESPGLPASRDLCPARDLGERPHQQHDGAQPVGVCRTKPAVAAASLRRLGDADRCEQGVADLSSAD